MTHQHVPTQGPQEKGKTVLDAHTTGTSVSAKDRPVHIQRRNTKLHRRRLDVLRRRRNYLSARMGSNRSNQQLDDMECKALNWAIWVCETWMEDDPNWVKDDKGKWRHLGEPYFMDEDGSWLVWEGEMQVTCREATDEEVEIFDEGLGIEDDYDDED